MRQIGTARRALRHAGRFRRPRPWIWASTVILVNLGLAMLVMLTIDQRLTEIERRVEAATEVRTQWRAELASARSELGTGVTELRTELEQLRRVVSTDDGDLRSGLEALGGRLGRIENRVAILWSAPANRTQARISS